MSEAVGSVGFGSVVPLEMLISLVLSWKAGEEDRGVEGESLLLAGKEDQKRYRSACQRVDTGC